MSMFEGSRHLPCRLGATKLAVPALEDIDYGALTPEQAAFLETLFVESEVLKDLNEARAESIGR